MYVKTPEKISESQEIFTANVTKCDSDVTNEQLVLENGGSVSGASSYAMFFMALLSPFSNTSCSFVISESHFETLAVNIS